MADRPLNDSLSVPSQAQDLDALLAEAESRRQDLEAAARRVDAAGLDVQSAYGQYFPSVSLNLQYFLQRGTDPTNLHWATLIQASLPLFSAGIIEADVRTALSRLRQAKLDYSRVRREVRRDIEVAMENLRASFERTERFRVQVRSAGDALEQAEGLYRAGLSTNLERLIAQDRLLTAQLELVNAGARQQGVLLGSQANHRHVARAGRTGAPGTGEERCRSSLRSASAGRCSRR